jgi:hypothetical protein
LVIVVRDVSSALLHPHDRRIDHLHRRVLTDRQRIHDPVPGTSLPPTELQTAYRRTGTSEIPPVTGHIPDMPKSTRMTLNGHRAFKTKTICTLTTVFVKASREMIA